MYIYIYWFTYTYIYIYIHIHIHIHIYLYIYIHTYTYIYIYVCQYINISKYFIFKHIFLYQYIKILMNNINLDSDYRSFHPIPALLISPSPRHAPCRRASRRSGCPPRSESPRAAAPRTCRWGIGRTSAARSSQRYLGNSGNMKGIYTNRYVFRYSWTSWRLGYLTKNCFENIACVQWDVQAIICGVIKHGWGNPHQQYSVASIKMVNFHEFPF